MFVADSRNAAVEEIPLNNGAYGASFVIGPRFGVPTGVAVDAEGNVIVADYFASGLKEIPLTKGSYGTTLLTLGYNEYPYAAAVDAQGRVYFTANSFSNNTFFGVFMLVP